MPDNPEQGRKPEQEPRPYYLASRFKTKQAAEPPYVAVQETIKTMDCDLSAYRFLRQWEEPSDKPWYVTVIGETPPDAVQTHVTAILSQGEMAPLSGSRILVSATVRANATRPVGRTSLHHHRATEKSQQRQIEAQDAGQIPPEKPLKVRF